jgi:hypothetical protein
MQSKATTVAKYLAELPADRRSAIQAVRKVILKNLDKGFEEGMSYGAIGYYVPHKLYPAGYHCNPSLPLPFGGLGSQKHYMSVGFMHIYGSKELDAWFRSAWAKSGKKLDMGKCCIRFRKLEDLPLDVIGKMVGMMSAKDYIDFYETTLRDMRSKKPKRTAPGKAKKKVSKKR